MKKRTAALITAVTMLLALAGCAAGGTSKAEDMTYKAHYDQGNTAEELHAIPDYQFLPIDLSNMITYGVAMDMSLDLNEDGSYTLDVHDYNMDESVEKGEDEFLNVHMVAEGTYEKTDNKVSIKKPEAITYTYERGNSFAVQDNFKALSLNDDGSEGEWTSDKEAKLLTYVPESTFTVTEGGRIVTWEKK